MKGLYSLAVVILIVAAAILFFKLEESKDQYAQMSQEFLEHKESSAEIISQLNSDIESEKKARDSVQKKYSALQSYSSELQQNYSSLDLEYSDLSTDYSSLKSEVQQTTDKIDTYKRDIETSMSWFKENSELTDEGKHELAKDYLDIYCIKFTDDECFIKTGCPYLVNQQKLRLEYKYDLVTSHELDKMQSIQEFVDSNGGDCEDYSLFYKAEWNYLLSECKRDKMIKKIIVDSWYQDGSSADTYWLDYDNDWYLDSVSSTYLPDGYIYPNVVCGNLYDLNHGKVGGHCVIAFTQEPIKTIQDLSLLDLAPMIEPQDGRYLGLINDVSSETILLKNGDKKEDYTAYIYTVITDDDYFLYSSTEEDWQSYSDFLMQLNQKEEELKASII